MTSTFKSHSNRLIFALAVFVGASVSSAFAKDPKALFRSDEVIKITVVAPMKDLTRTSTRSTDPFPATLRLEGAAPEEHAIKLSARGKSRRDRKLCNFPPLRVEFNEKPDDASLFDGQKRLKLVTHCRSSSRYQQYYMLEYTAYRLLNVITPLSLRVRMAEIDYIEADTGKTTITRFGFFIEDTDDAAKRNDMKEIDLPDITVSQLNAEGAARYALFQYMIGNLDWSMHNGPDGEDCCHNSKLTGATKKAVSDLFPIPYDFDYSGLVNTPYAVPPEGLRINTVRKRRYRGFCAHNDEALTEAAKIRAMRQQFNDEINAAPVLSDKNKRSAQKYLDGFFKNIETDEDITKRLLSYCRE